MGLTYRLMNRLAHEVVSQGTRLASQAIHEGMQVAQENARTQQVLAQERQRNVTRYQQDLLLAKLAVCYYIANVDGEMSDEERNEIGRLTNQILRGTVDPGERVRSEVQKINRNMGEGFVFAEKYLQPIKNGDLASYLQIAEEIASADADVTDGEKEALNKLRDYISDRTGKDFTENNFDESDLICQSCGGHMDISDGGGMLVCPFCGTTRVVNERKLYSELKEYNFGGVSVNDDFFDVLEARLSRGQKIESIKYVVDKLKLSLMDAKALVEAYENDMDRTKYDAKFRGQGRKIE